MPGLGDFVGDFFGGASDLVGGAFDFLGSNPSGTGAIISGLATLGTQLVASGVKEEELEIQREKLDLLEKQIEGRLGSDKDRVALAQQKLKVETALAAIKLARDAVPDRNPEIAARQAQISQGAADTRTQIDALDRLVARFSGAVK